MLLKLQNWIKVHNKKSSSKCENLLCFSNSLISEGTVKVTLEKCTFLEHGKFLIWTYLGT